MGMKSVRTKHGDLGMQVNIASAQIQGENGQQTAAFLTDVAQNASEAVETFVESAAEKLPEIIEAAAGVVADEIEEEKEARKEEAQEAVEGAMMGGADTEIEGDGSGAMERQDAMASMASINISSLKSGASLNISVPKPRCGSLFKIFLGWLHMMSSFSVTFDVPLPRGFLSIQRFIF